MGVAVGAGQELTAGEPQLALRTILFTDVVGSTKLKQALGDRKGVELIQRHHALVRETLRPFAGAEEIETAGDSFLILFETAGAAVAFALRLQARLRDLEGARGRAIFDRIAIHQGEIFVRPGATPGKSKDLFGLEVDCCARVLALANAKQILMTTNVFDQARRDLGEEELRSFGELAWIQHGSYQLKGLEHPVAICEVGERGFAVLQAPAESGETRRLLALDSEIVLGWRPAASQMVPGGDWKLERKLGEGGFGEVWLALSTRRSERRVLKFCFHADRARSLRREVTLLHLVRKRIGQHLNIVQLLDVHFEEPPFYLEMEYVEGCDLRSWAAERGGIQLVPTELRLELVAQMAEALQAAHDAGVIHRDVKPGNILIASSKTGGAGQPWQVKLTDFGIGQVMSEEYLVELTKTGFTRTVLSDRTSSQTGTQLYMAPELLAGKPATPRSDLYSLGVVLYQMLVGDFSRPVTADWTKEISDPLLQHDLSHCFSGNPQDRFTSAGELARNLRLLPERRAAQNARAVEVARLEKAAYRRGVFRTATVALVVIAAIGGLALFARTQAERARRSYAQVLLSHARSGRLSGLAGQRIDGLTAVREAAQIRPTLELRDEAIACLALTDLRRAHVWEGFPHGSSALAFNQLMTRYARGNLKGEVSVREVGRDGEIMRLQGTACPVEYLCFSPDGQRLAATSRTNFASFLRIWSLAGAAHSLLWTNAIAGRSVDFHPASNWVAIGQANGTVELYDWVERRSTRRFNSDRPSDCVRFSPDGARLAVASAASLYLEVHDLVGGPTIRLDYSEVPRDIAWHPNGRQLAVAYQDGQIYLWDLKAQRPRVLQGGAATPIRVAFTPDGNFLASAASDKTLWLWNPSTGLPLLKESHAPSPWLQFSPDGRRLGASVNETRLELYELSPAAECARCEEPDQNVRGLTELAVDSANGLVMAAGDAGVDFWDLDSARKLGSLRIGNVRSIAFSARTGMLFTSGLYGLNRFTVHTDELPDKRKVRLALAGTIEADPGAIRLTLSPDATTLGVVYGDRVVLLDSAGLMPKGELRCEPGLDAAVFGARGQWLAAANSRLGFVQIWNLRDQRLATSLPVQGQSSLAFSPDDQWLVTGNEQEYRFWSARTWKAVGEPIHRSQAQDPGAVAFSPDGQFAAVAMTGLRVRLVKTSSWEKLADLEPPEKGATTAIGFSSDAKQLVVLSDRPPLLSWDLPSLRSQLAALGLDWDSPRSSPRDRGKTKELIAPIDFGFLAAQQGFLDQVQKLSRRLATNSSDATAYFDRGSLYADLKIENRAIRDLEQAARLDPERLETWTSLAHLYLLGSSAIHNPEAGMHCALEAWKKQPSHYATLCYMGFAHAQAGKMQRALAFLEEAVTVASDKRPSVGNLLYQALAHHGLGNLERASALYRQALECLELEPGKRTDYVDRLITELQARQVGATVALKVPLNVSHETSQE